MGGAGDLIAMLGLTGVLEINDVALSALTSNADLSSVGLTAGQTNVTFAGNALQIDLDGNGSADFQIAINGASSVSYDSGDQLFHLA